MIVLKMNYKLINTFKNYNKLNLLMKIINNKGVKKNVSSFFHSKLTENEYKKHYLIFMIFLGIIYFIFSLLMFLLIETLLVAVLIIVTGGVIVYLLKDKYSQIIINTVIHKKAANLKKKEMRSKYKYSHLETSNSKKKNKVLNAIKNKKNNIKSKISKKKSNDDDSYIEIK